MYTAAAVDVDDDVNVNIVVISIILIKSNSNNKTKSNNESHTKKILCEFRKIGRAEEDYELTFFFTFLLFLYELFRW